jgi:hypothetical protein
MMMDIDKRLRKLEQAPIFQVPRVSADPSPVINGAIWYRTDLNTYRGYVGGVVRTFTVS